MGFAERIRNGLLVSCQYSAGDAFESPESAARFAKAAQDGGACGIRANGRADIAAIAAATGLPVIGIRKRKMEDGRILITPSLEEARELAEAGAAAVALDCTRRGQSFGALARVAAIRKELGVPVLADIATMEEAVAAEQAGADMVLSTMRGYTLETAAVKQFQPEFIAQLRRAVRAPVIAEGMIASPSQAGEAMRAGAWAVIVGTAITRPHELTRGFVQCVQWAAGEKLRLFAAVDLGATNTKFGLVDGEGQVIWSSVKATPAKSGREALLDHLSDVVERCQREAQALKRVPAAAGIAVSGWADPATGRIAFATSAMPGWTGAAVAEFVGASTGLPVIVENDARAAAAGERAFGAARQVRDFVCLTLGTGVGGGVFVNGRSVTGAAALGSAIGHIVVQPDGEQCVCGSRGCLEAYVNLEAVLRSAMPEHYDSGRDLVSAANQARSGAVKAVERMAAYLAIACQSLIHVLDPELIVLAGGLAQDNALLLKTLQERLDATVFARGQRRTRIAASRLGYQAGLIGAAALARDC
ncbi:MAG: putative N-acetylmannosamine-6-phosphate 2-epimerase [Acidobacteria bacterium]|nr:putative N-acetylmannosamine-6-phosphate 2-epimerase [Acidobacteriota bacterium]